MTLDCSHYRRPPHFPSAEENLVVVANWTIDRKDHFCFEHTRERRGQAAPTTGDCSRCDPKTPLSTRQPKLPGDRRFQIGQDRMCFLFTMLDNPPKFP